MILVSVLYPGGADTRFDMSYYLGHHMKLVRERWTPLGLREARVLRGVGTPSGAPAPYQVMALLSFDSAEAFAKAAAAHGEEIFADIPAFTDVEAVVQINDFPEPVQGR